MTMEAHCVFPLLNFLLRFQILQELLKAIKLRRSKARPDAPDTWEGGYQNKVKNTSKNTYIETITAKMLSQI